MTDKELRKLSRTALLEMLVEQSRENDRLRAEVEQLHQQLSSRQLLIDRAGTIAEASLQINQVFEAAQKAAEQYLENIRLLSGRQEQVCRQMEEESGRKAKMLLEETERKCRAMETESAERCAGMKEETQRKLESLLGDRMELYNLLCADDEGRGQL